MAYFLRTPKMPDRGERADGTKLGVIHYRREGHPFVTGAPLVMHDACAHTPDIAGDPWADDRGSMRARDAFAAQAGPGFDLCWAPIYSDRDDAPACYVCGTPVKGRG